MKTILSNLREIIKEREINSEFLGNLAEVLRKTETYPLEKKSSYEPDEDEKPYREVTAIIREKEITGYEIEEKVKAGVVITLKSKKVSRDELDKYQP